MSRDARTRLRLAAACVLALATLAAPSPAAAGNGVDHNPSGRLLGAVPARGAKPVRARTLAATAADQMTYHGGPVVHDGHVYAIFWEPPGYAFPPGYRAAIAKYFYDVAADSGRRGNVYSINRQYGDGLGPALYRVAFAGSYTDTSALPPNGCENAATAVCLSDDQLSSELASFVTGRSLPRGLASQYFLFTPPGVGTCFEASSDECAYQSYCAYHSFTGGLGVVLYAVHPYIKDVASCDVGESPTGTSADAVLNVVSHEHNEIITDPTGSGWFDSAGEENGDKCAWSFGSTLGLPGASFNQVLAGSGYLLQLEWSNARAGCVGREPNFAPTPSVVRRGKAVARNRLLFDASGSRDRDGRVASYSWRFGDGTRVKGRLAAHAYAHAGTYRVRLVVTDDEGATAIRAVDVRVTRPG